MNHWTKQKLKLAKSHAASEGDNGNAEISYAAGYDQARKDMLEALGEFDTAGVNKLIRQRAKNAVCMINEVDSDIDYYSDTGKADGLLEGARWQFEQIKKKLGLG